MTTSTILFTDISASTARLAAAGDDAGARELSGHLDMIRHVVADFGGR